MVADVRKPPTAAVFALHPQGVRGTCCWCGKPCEEKTPGRGWLKWWHDACEWEFKIIIRPDDARRAVLDRDHGICCDCGEDWSGRYLLRKGGLVITGPEWEVARRWKKSDNEQYHAERAAGFWQYHDLVYISLWHVDHKIPLWKVRHMPDLQRLEYFKLANLITRCHVCHQRKSDGETAERAKIKKRDKVKKPKQKIQSRGFEKRKTTWPKRKLRGST